MIPFFSSLSSPSFSLSFSLSPSLFLSPSFSFSLSTTVVVSHVVGSSLFLLRSDNPFSLVFQNPAKGGKAFSLLAMFYLFFLLFLHPSSPLFLRLLFLMRIRFSMMITKDCVQELTLNSGSFFFPVTCHCDIFARFKFRKSCYTDRRFHIYLVRANIYVIDLVENT